ncbi:hypothetical protein EBZ39_15985 [bacterium]|nr:hypothetical protein [bacterium]
MKEIFFVELTDTYGGEANYAWVKRFKVHASSILGAVRKVGRETGFSFRKNFDCGDLVRYDSKNSCHCIFVSGYTDEAEHTFNVQSI